MFLVLLLMETALDSRIKVIRFIEGRRGVFLFYYLLLMLSFFIVNGIDYYFEILYQYQSPPKTIYNEIVAPIIVAPVVETIINLVIPYLVLSRFLGINNFFTLIIIAVSFSLAHKTHYDLYEFLYFFIAGSVLGWYFIKLYENGSMIHAIIVSILLHSIFNLTVTALIHIF
ncbi:CAAX protease self-immunity [Dysgonomonas macrotermitis]|uniref:CAAX protease self-immunity n=2 Tax=Dysgonomonas macrotermitis TaxID=1346286 RepID=A0A1M5FR88_9BACT|nr:CAAX protease self-immunity [Dysgonomonas macrotermitis]